VSLIQFCVPAFVIRADNNEYVSKLDVCSNNNSTSCMFIGSDTNLFYVYSWTNADFLDYCTLKVFLGSDFWRICRIVLNKDSFCCPVFYMMSCVRTQEHTHPTFSNIGRP
jgi:hypothetical protein